MGMTIRQARRMKDISQKEMAETLEVSEDTYRRIERDPERASIRQAKIISKTTGVSIDEIFFDRDSSLTRDRHTA